MKKKQANPLVIRRTTVMNLVNNTASVMGGGSNPCVASLTRCYDTCPVDCITGLCISFNLTNCDTDLCA
jgi:hypothetical protein